MVSKAAHTIFWKSLPWKSSGSVNACKLPAK
jgi:hypothetical protein